MFARAQTHTQTHASEQKKRETQFYLDSNRPVELASARANNGNKYTTHTHTYTYIYYMYGLNTFDSPFNTILRLLRRRKFRRFVHTMDRHILGRFDYDWRTAPIAMKMNEKVQIVHFIRFTQCYYCVPHTKWHDIQSVICFSFLHCCCYFYCRNSKLERTHAHTQR